MSEKKPQSDNQMQKMMEAAQSSQKPKGGEKASRSQSENTIIKNLEETTAKVVQEVTKGILDMVNPLILWSRIVSGTRPLFAQADDQIKNLLA